MVRFDPRVAAVCAGLTVFAGCGSSPHGAPSSSAMNSDIEACTVAANQLGYREVVHVAMFTDIRGLGCSVQVAQGRLVQIIVRGDGGPPVDLGEP